MRSFCLAAAEPFAVLATFKQVEIVHWRITCLIRNALRIHCSNECFRIDTRKLSPLHMKEVGVLSVARASRVQLLRRDPIYASEKPIEQARVLVPMRSLCVQACELHVE